MHQRRSQVLYWLCDNAAAVAQAEMEKKFAEMEKKGADHDETCPAALSKQYATVLQLRQGGGVGIHPRV